MSAEADPQVPELVARWVGRTPAAVAVRQGDDRRTYAELDALSARVAAGLLAAGCGPEARVALLLERTVDLPAVVLGALRAGCCYVPLDPAQPESRLAGMLADSGARVVLTDVEPLPLRPDDGVLVLALDELPDAGAPVVPATHPDQLAYLLYTSGSTGRPKGVGVTCGGLANCLISTLGALRPKPGDRLLALTTISFDIATLEMFLPLVSGGELVLTRTAESRSGDLLNALLRHWRPRFVHATPASWELLFLAGWEGDPELVVMCGGDVVGPRLAAGLTACTARVWHLYGPTETTMYSVRHALDTGPQPTVLSIGTPIRATDARVVDESLRTVHAGVVGELCLSGAGVARGYPGRPGATAERFVPDPEVPGGRLYRTGDLARRLPDGTLQLHGRDDRQIKIRGHRVEPGEVEHVLTGHPDLSRAAVVAIGERGDERLLAFVQPRDRPPSPALLTDVRGFAESRLPAALAPSSYAGIAELPLTPNGKLDRALLSRVRPPASAAAAPRRDGPQPHDGARLGKAPVVFVTRNEDPYQDWLAATEEGRPVRLLDEWPAMGVPGRVLLAGWAQDAVAAFLMARHLDGESAEQPPLLLVDAPEPPFELFSAGPYYGPVHHVLSARRDAGAWSSLTPRGQVIRVPGEGSAVLRGEGARRLAAVVAHVH